jgi:branched-chain amino acid transport system ATP-binding protein
MQTHHTERLADDRSERGQVTVVGTEPDVLGTRVPSAAPLLEVRGVSKRFGGVVALDGVDLVVGPGEVCGVIGPNGAGKTTLFDVISGITMPSAGAVSVAGEDVTQASPGHRVRLGMRRTFQRTQLFGWLSVEDNVLASVEWRGGGGGLAADLLALPGRRRRERERRERAREVLEWCGLTAVRSTLAADLPLGSARLVELARAVVDRPCLLLLDEPTSGLGVAEADRFGELVASMRAEGCAVLLVEHDVGFVMRLCDRIVVLNLGSVLTDGTPAEIHVHPGVRDAYLG